MQIQYDFCMCDEGFVFGVVEVVVDDFDVQFVCLQCIENCCVVWVDCVVEQYVDILFDVGWNVVQFWMEIEFQVVCVFDVEVVQFCEVVFVVVLGFIL